MLGNKVGASIFAEILGPMHMCWLATDKSYDNNNLLTPAYNVRNLVSDIQAV